MLNLMYEKARISVKKKKKRGGGKSPTRKPRASVQQLSVITFGNLDVIKGETFQGGFHCSWAAAPSSALGSR